MSTIPTFQPDCPDAGAVVPGRPIRSMGRRRSRAAMVTGLVASAALTAIAAGPAHAETAIPLPSPVPTSSSPSPADPGAGQNLDLGLPRIPWEGGASYYAQFPDAARAGWSDPKHFPIALWWGQAGTDEEMAYDKSLGINTYVILNPASDYHLLDRNHMDYIGTALDGQPRDDPSWVGDFLDDEVDGRYSQTEGLAYLAGLTSELPDHNKIRYANYTGMTISWQDPSHADWATAAKRYVNDFTDAVSLDAYWYSSAQCDWDDPNGAAFLTPFPKASCRDAQAYGRNVTSLRAQDATDNRLQPVWNFIENVDVAPDGVAQHDLSPDEVKAAAMSSIIHEARGLAWFNNSFGGKCATGNAVRSTQNNPAYPCATTVKAMAQVNTFIQSLAPVLNTQSWAWDAGQGVETMLKTYQGAGYLFAMPSDIGGEAGAGAKTLRIPDALKGKPVEVLGENRTLTPNPDGTITDTFASVNSYHVYKIG